jgi:ABC-type transport system involved in multi-copper enzyme maturation permease subunit
MNYYKSTFRSELAIVPTVARMIAALAFVLMQIALLVLVPIYVSAADRPPHAALVAISIFGGIFLAIIILLIGYVNADSKRRGMNSLLWTLLVIFIPKALGFLAYFLLRKPLLMNCPKCGNSIGSDFRFCPKCGYSISPTCVHCGRPISRDYVCCPYCGKPVQPTVPQNLGTLPAK